MLEYTLGQIQGLLLTGDSGAAQGWFGVKLNLPVKQLEIALWGESSFALALSRA